MHMGLVLGIWVVFRPLGQLLGDDVLVERDQAGLDLLLHLGVQERTVSMLTSLCTLVYALAY